MKRNISIRDDSGASVEITLWGTYSSEPGDQLEEVCLISLAYIPCPYTAACVASHCDYNEHPKAIGWLH
jgi:hypothetical protein